MEYYNSQICLTPTNYLLLLIHYFINNLFILTSKEKIFYVLKMNLQYGLFILISEI
jgi:hypothetical protein